MKASKIIISDPEILGGTPCFAGTRVPVEILFEYLSDGETLEYFLKEFPSVSREQTEALLVQAKHWATTTMAESA